MADPFDVLRTPIEVIAPDAEFAARLRERIERALSLPKGVTVSDIDLDLDRAVAPRATGPRATSFLPGRRPAPRSDDRSHPRVATVTPYLALAGAAEAIEWYGSAFGAHLRSNPIVMPDGRIGHAELEIGGALVMLSDEHPEIGVVAPSGAASVTLHMSVGDVDSVIGGAVAKGAVLERPASDYEYGRNGVIRDPFGHRWLVSAEPETVPERDGAFREGDIGYMSLWVGDVARATTFFSSVFGWRYGPASSPQGRRVEGLSVHHGLFGGDHESTLFLCFAVDDVDIAAQRVRSAGGTASVPHLEPYGRISDCVDDQGIEFALFQPPGGHEPQAGAFDPTGLSHYDVTAPDDLAASDDVRARDDARSAPALRPVEGDVAYVTMEVRDSAKARDFYGSVIGWRFSPGRVDDGWQVLDVVPMVGLSGGHERNTTVSMYSVADIETTVEEVRRSGGTATDPETQPYGITAACTDDQGTRFYVGQLYVQ